MSEDRRSRRLNIPDPVAPPAVEPDRARRIDIPATPEKTPEPARVRHIIAPPVVEAVAPQPQRDRSITPPMAEGRVENRQRPSQGQRTRTDELIDKAQSIDPKMTMMRLRGRIDAILPMSVSQILDWGDRNLTPLQDTSNRKAKIAGDIMRINAAGWLTESKNASCKVPSFFDRFSAKPPSFYEGMLKKVRGELIQFVKELDQMGKDFFCEVGDLHCDALAMLVCADDFKDDNCKIAAHNRAKTLMASHQTAATLQQTIEMSLQQSAQFIQQIDDFMSVTLPNWKMAYGS